MSPKKKSFIISLLFLAVVIVASFLGYLPKIIVYLYLIMSALTFAIYAWDKSSAKRNKSRTPEATLHYLSLFGGWPGALIAQQLLRHKSIKKTISYVVLAYSAIEFSFINLFNLSLWELDIKENKPIDFYSLIIIRKTECKKYT